MSWTLSDTDDMSEEMDVIHEMIKFNELFPIKSYFNGIKMSSSIALRCAGNDDVDAFLRFVKKNPGGVLLSMTLRTSELPAYFREQMPAQFEYYQEKIDKEIAKYDGAGDVLKYRLGYVLNGTLYHITISTASANKIDDSISGMSAAMVADMMAEMADDFDGR